MPLTQRNLDDRTYTDLLEEALASIPSICPEWTDHNPSDPGITLIELLAWLTEMLIYRVDRVPEAQYLTFLKLLNGPQWRPDDDPDLDLEGHIKKSVLALRERYRAATSEDFELLATQQWPKTSQARDLGTESMVKRALSLPRRNLDSKDPAERAAPAPAHISLVVVPDGPDNCRPQPTEELRNALWIWLDERRLLTTRHHVIGPEYVPITVNAQLALLEGAQPSEARRRGAQKLTQFFDPLRGGPGSDGWPFGRDVYISQVYQLLESVVGVDFVSNVAIETPDAWRVQRGADDGFIGITLHAHELVDLRISEANFSTR